MSTVRRASYTAVKFVFLFSFGDSRGQTKRDMWKDGRGGRGMHVRNSCVERRINHTLRASNGLGQTDQAMM